MNKISIEYVLQILTVQLINKMLDIVTNFRNNIKQIT